MIIFPAIDIIGGKAVRLTKGDYGLVETFGEPVDIAKSFVLSGAKYLHTVDLDGARSGNNENFETVKSLVDVGLNVQVGGGIRDINRIERYVSVGVKRVILGTAAVKSPAFLQEAVRVYGDKIAVGVDAKGGYTATDGWEKVTQINSFDFCRRLRDMGVKTIIYTDILTDGMMQGTNMKNFEELVKIDGLNIIASGGVTYYDEIKALSEMGIYGVILGKALYKGLLDLKTAIALAEGR